MLRFSQREEFSKVPLSENYQEANKIVSSLWSLTQFDGFGSTLSSDDLSTLLNFTRLKLVKNSRTQSALTRIASFQDLEQVVMLKGSAKATVKPRTTEWLEKHGESLHLFCQGFRRNGAWLPDFDLVFLYQRCYTHYMFLCRSMY